MNNEQTTVESGKAALLPFIESLGLTYAATFVPQSQSRNAAEKNRSLNWRVSITTPQSRNTFGVVTDYMQGIGHLPKPYPREFKPDLRITAQYEAECAEKGKHGQRHMKPIPAPALVDVLYSLVRDAGDTDNQTFDDWCAEYDYDTDSRKAEANYDECRDIGVKLRRMIGREALEKLRELFQDY